MCEYYHPKRLFKMFYIRGRRFPRRRAGASPPSLPERTPQSFVINCKVFHLSVEESSSLYNGSRELAGSEPVAAHCAFTNAAEVKRAVVFHGVGDLGITLL